MAWQQNDGFTKTIERSQTSPDLNMDPLHGVKWKKNQYMNKQQKNNANTFFVFVVWSLGMIIDIFSPFACLGAVALSCMNCK